jgi:hypothetical protein
MSMIRLKPILAFTALLLLTVAGCSKKTTDEASNDQAESSENQTKSKVNVVSPSKSLGAASPAGEPNSELNIGAEPHEVCSEFLNALVAKDYVHAQRMLTRASQHQTRIANLELQAPGSHSAIYNVLPAEYATDRKETARVDCEITDTINGSKAEYVVTWILRNQQSGWKISGMMLPTGNDAEQDYLCFENPDDVMRIKLAVSGDSTAATKIADDTGNTTLK